MIASCCKTLKQDFKPRKHPLDKPIRFWSEKDNLDGNIVDTYVIILYTRGCSWAYKSGCSMCGYFNDSAWRDIPNEMLIKQFKNALQNYNGEKILKIFTSGSFLDEIEIPRVVRDTILNMIPDEVDRIIVESRPEYIIEETLIDIQEHIDDKDFEIGIGLETSDDIIRNKIITKGFTVKDYRDAIDIIKRFGFRSKTYILIKPPSLT
ncbi:MAG TPA: TIGR01210 family radical SAM protein, partial [Thermoplasmatales archaeon]|nr:TIGR01210 family radical SAM protein [Thermoplasmatales archaeon]